MRIKFKHPDPRAGAIAQMDSRRGQQLVDDGAAVQVSEDGSEMELVAADSAGINVAETARSTFGDAAVAVSTESAPVEPLTAETAARAAPARNSRNRR